MKKLLIILIGCFLLIGCKSSKMSVSQIDEYKKQLLESIEKINSLEKESNTYKDSLLFVKGLVEKSSSFGLDSSYLETSYAKSVALINQEGKLKHTLENKDSIPSKIIYQNKYIYKERTDSIYINKIDTIYKTDIKKETIIKEVTFGEKIKYICLGIVVCLIGLGAYCLIKRFKK